MVYEFNRGPSINEIIDNALTSGAKQGQKLRQDEQAFSQLLGDPAMGKSLARMDPRMQQVAMRSLLSNMGNQDTARGIAAINSRQMPSETPQQGPQQDPMYQPAPEQGPMQGPQQQPEPNPQDMLNEAMLNQSPISRLLNPQNNQNPLGVMPTDQNQTDRKSVV